MLPLELSSAKGARQRALELLEQVGLSARAGHYPRQLSGGEQQRVALARAFVVEPDILFADEPTGNLDAVNGGHIEELLFAMNQQRGTTLVLVTHEPHLAELCERRFEMRDGQLAEQH